ncbi:MAG TPA: hypothetical protein VFZ68_16635 [Acidimicrobiales bacterium]
MPNEKIYIHELIEIAGLNRARYVQHMTANWSPTAQEDRGQLCYGVWPVVGSTGRWPQVVNLWEMNGWDGLAAGFGLETGGRGAYDPKLERWWAHAAEMRRGGVDRIVVPAPWARTIEELCADGVRGECYAHDLVRVRPGAAAELLERVRDRGQALAGEHGWVLAGAFRTAMANDDECILVWAIPSWGDWAAHERAHLERSEVAAWRRSLDDLVTGWHRTLMVDAPLCPFRTGRQPRREDRVDWED